ncbi:MAG: transposase [Kiritimatiellales bacterium]
MDSTKQQDSLPQRQRRLTNVFDSTPAYFLTICTKDRKAVLNSETVHERVRKFSEGSMERYSIWVDSYVLMPDHAHLIITVSGNTKLSDWVKSFKAFVGNRKFCWQEGFFDHVLRSDESRSEKWQYIRMNPVRAGLVATPDTWPYTGWFDPRTGSVGRVTSPGAERSE